LKNKQDGVLDKDKMMGNVQKHNIVSMLLLNIIYTSSPMHTTYNAVAHLTCMVGGKRGSDIAVVIIKK
jgi:hypothetical protein